MKKFILLLSTALCTSLSLMANNIKIENVVASNSQVTFNLSWDNSWNSTDNVDLNYPNNWDAAWVFVKVQSNSTNLWYHQNLAATGHSITPGTDGANLSIETQSDKVGVFIRRTNAGYGNISSATVTLQFDALPPGTTFNVKVFGIEMVYIPEGDFYLNDDVTAPGLYEKRFLSVTVDNATQNTSGFDAAALYGGSPALSTSWPMGYNAFYAMKYEVSNQQVADFLNTLTYDQQADYFTNAPNSATNTTLWNQISNLNNYRYLRIQTPGVNNTTPAVVGCNYNGNTDFNELADGNTVAAAGLKAVGMISYLDWCGLRPMTEMEFEKICRGTKYDGTPNARVLNEYAWGTTTLTNYGATNAGIADIHQPTMRFTGTVVNGRGNFGGNTIPFRTGMWADGATGRAAAGAGFYGNMNMSDNLEELVVGVHANSAGYTAQPGDGVLDNDGFYNQSTWPAIGTAGAYGAKGGRFNANPTQTGQDYYTRMAKVSNRYFANDITAATFSTSFLGRNARGVR